MANDPNTIQYVIQEDGFWYVASKDRTPGVPEITVSAKGVANGLSTEYNDGYDFGPDTYNPNSTANPPYTETAGIQEAYNYIIAQNGGEIKLTTGIFTLNEPVIMDSAVNIKITGSVVSNPTANSNPTDYLAGTLIVPSASFPTTSDITPTGVAYLFESMPSVRNYGVLQIENIAFLGNTIANYGTQGSIGAIASGSSNGYIPRVIMRNLKFHLCLYTADIVNLGGPMFLDNIHLTDCGYGFRLDAVDAIIGLYEAFANTVSGIEFGNTFPNTYSPSQPWSLVILYLNTSNQSGVPFKISYGDDPGSQLTANRWAANINIHNWISVSLSASVTSLITATGYGSPIDMHVGSLYSSQYISTFLTSNAQTPTYGDYGSFNLHIDTLTLELEQDLTWYVNQNTVSGTVTATPVTIKISKVIPLLNNYTISDLASDNSVLIDAPDFSSVISPTTPSVPSSGTAQQNTNPYPVNVYVYGGDVTEIQITRNGTAYTVLSVSTAIAMSGQVYKLNPGDSITLTYSTAPSWEWLSD